MRVYKYFTFHCSLLNVIKIFFVIFKATTDKKVSLKINFKQLGLTLMTQKSILIMNTVLHYYRRNSCGPVTLCQCNLYRLILMSCMYERHTNKSNGQAVTSLGILSQTITVVTVILSTKVCDVSCLH